MHRYHIQGMHERISLNFFHKFEKTLTTQISIKEPFLFFRVLNSIADAKLANATSIWFLFTISKIRIKGQIKSWLITLTTFCAINVDY